MPHIVGRGGPEVSAEVLGQLLRVHEKTLFRMVRIPFRPFSLENSKY